MWNGTTLTTLDHHWQKSSIRSMSCLDKTKFRAGKIENQERIHDKWLERPLLERLSAAWILSCRAHNLDPNAIHPVDRTKFKVRRRDG